jgi:hypothetical protein
MHRWSSVPRVAGPAAARYTDEALASRVVAEHLVSPRVGEEHAAAVVDEHAVRLSELWRRLCRQCDRDEKQRQQE